MSQRTWLSGAVAVAMIAGCGGDHSPSNAHTIDAGSGADGRATQMNPDATVATDAPDMAQPTWTSRTTGALHVARMRHVAVKTSNGHVIVIGGELADQTELDSIEDFDPAAEQWTEVAHLPAPRSNLAAVLL